MVTKDGCLVTRPLSQAILPGVVRAIVFELAAQLGLDIEERVFSVEEALAAKEAFVTSTGGVMPVVAIDGQTVANGAPGDVTTTLVAAFRQHLANQTNDAAATLQVLSEPS
jgi:D-alanine transaminase